MGKVNAKTSETGQNKPSLTSDSQDFVTKSPELAESIPALSDVLKNHCHHFGIIVIVSVPYLETLLPGA